MSFVEKETTFMTCARCIGALNFNERKSSLTELNCGENNCCNAFDLQMNEKSLHEYRNKLSLKMFFDVKNIKFSDFIIIKYSRI